MSRKGKGPVAKRRALKAKQAAKQAAANAPFAAPARHNGPSDRRANLMELGCDPTEHNDVNRAISKAKRLERIRAYAKANGCTMTQAAIALMP